MKTEIEARLLEVKVEEVISKLQKAGAQLVGDWLQKRHCYDFKPITTNKWIRLRTNGAETTLTIKEVGSAQIDGTQEAEITVSDFDTTDEILNKLGYKARSIQENRRIQYKLDGVEIDIDFWPLIPTYVEFEAESQDAIEKVCQKLDINFSKLVTFGVQAIYKKYGYELKDIAKIQLEEERKTTFSSLTESENQ